MWKWYILERFCKETKERGCDFLTVPSSHSWNMDMMAGILTASFVHEITLGMEATYARVMRQKEVEFLPSFLISPGLTTSGILT